MTDGPSIDEILMQRVSNDDADSMDELVNRYASRLMTIIRRMIGDHHRSEEIFQDVVLAIWKNREKYDFPRPVRPWVFKIAVNRCREALRKKDDSMTNKDLIVGSALSRNLLQTGASADESNQLVKDAVSSLPEQQRAVVVLRIWNGMSYLEIAEVVGVGESTVRSYMHHALKSLRARLAPHGL